MPIRVIYSSAARVLKHVTERIRSLLRINSQYKFFSVTCRRMPIEKSKQNGSPVQELLRSTPLLLFQVTAVKNIGAAPTVFP